MSYEPQKLEVIKQAPENAPVTFGVVNHIGKHSREFVHCWAKILNRIPEAQLIVKSLEFADSDLRLKVMDLLESLGLDRSRIRLLGQTYNYSDHLGVYNSIDICLDPFPYTGGTSTADALLMGVPVVTLSGDALKSRMSTSMLTALGKPEWITSSIDEYVELACELGKKKTSLDEKLALREQFLNSEVTNTEDMTHHVEQAFSNMWEKYATLVEEKEQIDG